MSWVPKNNSGGGILLNVSELGLIKKAPPSVLFRQKETSLQLESDCPQLSPYLQVTYFTCLSNPMNRT